MVGKCKSVVLFTFKVSCKAVKCLEAARKKSPLSNAVSHAEMQSVHAKHKEAAESAMPEKCT